MSQRQAEKLQAAAEFVAGERAAGVDDEATILGLVAMYGASYDPRWDAARLRCAGVASSCTWSKTTGLLNNWIKTATIRLAQASMAAVGRGRAG